MSKFSKEQLYELYGKYLPIFTEIANEAIKNGVDLALDVDDEGCIKFSSSEYVKENGELRLVRKHYITQSESMVADGSQTFKT